MAQSPTPEFYLSLLSGRYGSVSRLSTEEGNNNVEARLADPHPFPKDPDQLTDLLDAFAAICIHEPKEVFFVSLSVDPNGVKLYVAANEEVPVTVVSHLYDVRIRLQKLKAVVQTDSSISADSETSPNTNVTPLRTNAELELQKVIYTHSYNKLQRHFLKRAPAIIDEYHTIIKSLQSDNISDKYTKILDNTRPLLSRIRDLLEKKLSDLRLIDLIETIDLLGEAWKEDLKDVGNGKGVLDKWENSIHVQRNRILSLRRLLEKLLRLHFHVHTIARIAWSRRLAPVLEGEFKVICVPATQSDISVKFSYQDVSSVIFPPGDQTNESVKIAVYRKLLKQVQTKAKGQGIDFDKGSSPEISMTVNIHAESNLLVYHLRHPLTHPYFYFGGSKLSCHACATLFSSFNRVAESFEHRQYFTKGSHGKICLRWCCPSLLSETEVKELRLKDQSESFSLNARVKEEMTTVLRAQLAGYINELHVVSLGALSPTQSDSTTASEASNKSTSDLIARLKTKGESELPPNDRPSIIQNDRPRMIL